MGAQTAQRLGYGGAHMTVALWQTWEIRRHLLATEYPGRFGYYTNAEASE